MPGAGTFTRSLCAGLHMGLLSGPLPQLSHKIPKEQGGKEESKYQGGEESTTPLLLGKASQKLSRRDGRDEILPGESLLSEEVIVLDLTCSLCAPRLSACTLPQTTRLPL